MRNGLGVLFSSIRGKIMLSFFLCVVLPVALIIYNAYSSSQDVLRKQIMQNNQDAMQRVAANMDGLAERAMNASNLIINDPEIGQFLQDEPDWTTRYDSFQRYQSVQTKLSNIKDIMMDSDAVVAVIDFRGYVHGASVSAGGRDLFGKLSKEPWYEATLRERGWPHWQMPYLGALSEGAGSGKRLFVLTRLIKSPQGDLGAGIVFIGIPSASFFPGPNLQSGAAQPNTLILADGGHRLLDAHGATLPVPPEQALQAVVANGGNAFTKQSFAGREYVYSTVHVPRLGWDVIELVPQTELMTQLKRIKNASFIWLTALFLLFTFVFIFLMLRFTKPIRALLLSMGRVGKGDFNAQVAVKGNDEIARLGIHFNRMIDSLQELIARLSDEQKRKEEAKYQALQAQINPHFLFNTLNSIRWMAVLSGAHNVSHMMTRLGKLLEFSMKHDRELISLEEEFSHLEAYLDLQKIRFHDNVIIESDIPDELKRRGILKFTLQPIVENSIIHGNRMPLRIVIRAAQTDDGLELTVADNGKGMERHKLDELRARLDSDHARYNGIGIHNVHERIRMHFGDRYGVDLHSVPEQGTTVTIRMPLVEP